MLERSSYPLMRNWKQPTFLNLRTAKYFLYPLMRNWKKDWEEEDRKQLILVSFNEELKGTIRSIFGRSDYVSFNEELKGLHGVTVEELLSAVSFNEELKGT